MKITLLKSLSCISLLLLIARMAIAQDPIVFSQYQLNPFQFNPSYASQNGYAEANLFYRQQWVGVENAPVSAAFNIQAPVGKNVSLGFTASTNKVILLSNSAALATFAYRVRMGYYHHLNFGISGGVALNSFDLDAVANSNDPALANIAQNNMYAAAQFGINYQYKNFNFGFALPQLLDSKPNSTEKFQGTKFNTFGSKFGSLSYAFNLGNVQLTPTVLYRALEAQQDQWEGMVTANYKTFLWVGASYRDGYGITGMIGVRLKGVLRVGYAYERPIGKLSKATMGSHEVYAGLRFGKRDREEEFFLSKKKKDSLAWIAKTEKELEKQKQEALIAEQKPKEEVITKQEPEPVVTKQEPVTQTPGNQPVVVTQEPPVEKVEKKEKGVFTGYYVVVGAFRSSSNAAKQMREVRSKSLFPEMLYILEKNYYYVYTSHSEKRDDAANELRKVRSRYPRAWIFAPTQMK